MIGMYAIIAIALLAGGMAVGIVAVVSIGIRREERVHSLTDLHSPGRTASAARAAHALYTRTPPVAYGGGHQRDNLLLLRGGGGQPS
jgi:hypothetical protein